MQIEQVEKEILQFDAIQGQRNAKEIFTSGATRSSMGSQGQILVSLMMDSGSSGFAGHAAIVSSNASITIESFAKNFSPIKKDGVQRYSNQWGSRKGALLYKAKGATSAQHTTAVKYAEKQIGKPYNWQFWEKTAENKFYCSQLVWMAWRKAGIDIEAGSIPNGIIAPADIANSSNTILLRHIS